MDKNLILSVVVCFVYIIIIYSILVFITLSSGDNKYCYKDQYVDEKCVKKWKLGFIKKFNIVALFCVFTLSLSAYYLYNQKFSRFSGGIFAGSGMSIIFISYISFKEMNKI